MRLLRLARQQWLSAAAMALMTVLPVSGEPSQDILKPVLHIEPISEDPEQLTCRFNENQIRLLEKLNRADRGHLPALEEIVVPDRWDLGELAYSPLPECCETVGEFPKILLVHQPGQVFGAYQFGKLVRWGPVSSGTNDRPTPAGLFFLNWKSPGRRSTLNENWFLPWYFNFHNKRGHSFHQFELPGQPASHGCIRLLERDAIWIYEWGEQWVLGPKGWTIKKSGTPVLIVDQYKQGEAPLWRSPKLLKSGGRLELNEKRLRMLLAGERLTSKDEPAQDLLESGD